MSEITAAQVKELRDRTGSGLMNCKNALVECNGNIDEAVDWLRKKGFATAAKKAGRVAADGIVSIKSDGRNAVILETNSETDFVSRSDEFKEFAAKTTDILFDNPISKVDDLLQQTYDATGSVSDKIVELISVIGENIAIRRLDRVSVQQGIVSTYVHNAVMPGFGKIGVLLALESDCANSDALGTLGKHIAMHIAASTELVALSVGDVDENMLKREREIAAEQAKQSGKNDEIVAKMIEGRIKKFYKESVLLEQTFFMEPDKTIQSLLDGFAKDNSCSIKIARYVKYVLGEGIEKETVDFATEVQNQLKS